MFRFIVLLLFACGAQAEDRLGLYASLGSTIHHYEVDVTALTLSHRGSVEAPARVQYAWPNADASLLYVATSSGGPGRDGTVHTLSAYAIDGDNGALSAHGATAALPERPIHVSLSTDGRFALVAFNASAMIEVFRIEADGSVGPKVAQPRINAGAYAHQVRQAPGGTVFSVGLGTADEPGSLTTFAYADGHLTRTAHFSLARPLGPRHLDFDPARGLVYVSVEHGNMLHAYGFVAGRLAATPRYRGTTLAAPGNLRQGQHAGTLHLHPRGHVLYVANRANHVGAHGFSGGENGIAVFSLGSGRPMAIQHVDSDGIEPRTFSLDPSGRMMVVANQMRLGEVPASLAVFAVAPDGKLRHVRSYPISDDGLRPLFWSAMVARDNEGESE